MARLPRHSLGGIAYHVMNRSHGHIELFASDRDYRLFENLLWDARELFPTELLAFCLMPNHFHLLLRPTEDGELSGYMKWLANAHTRRYHKLKDSVGRGPIYQGRFKSVIVTDEDQYLSVWRYVERNAFAANLCARSGAWRWGSLWWRLNRSADARHFLAEHPFVDQNAWARYVDEALTVDERQMLEGVTWNH